MEGKTISKKNYKIYYWFDKQYKVLISKGGNIKEIERLLLANHFKKIYPKAQIQHRESEAPVLIGLDNMNISLSHYKGWFAYGISKGNIGVDIQSFKENISAGRYYFISEYEENKLELTNSNLRIIWSAKEAFYKFKIGAIDNLKNDIKIESIDSENSNVTLIYEKQTYILNYIITEEIVLVWIVGKKNKENVISLRYNK